MNLDVKKVRKSKNNSKTISKVPKQLSFDSNPSFEDHKKRTEHGGGLRKGKRKLHRPFVANQALHVTMRSGRARRTWSFVKARNEKVIMSLIYVYAARFGVKVISFANAGNHLHLLIKAASKKGLQNFLRALCGMIPRKVAGAEKGRKIGKFWDELAYSKLITWSRHFKNTFNYVFRNALEGAGVIPARERARGHVTFDYTAIFDND